MKQKKENKRPTIAKEPTAPYPAMETIQINIEKSIAEKAMRYAQRKGSDLTTIITEYLSNMINEKSRKTITPIKKVQKQGYTGNTQSMLLSDDIKSIMGSIPASIDWKKEKSSYLEQKYK